MTRNPTEQLFDRLQMLQRKADALDTLRGAFPWGEDEPISGADLVDFINDWIWPMIADNARPGPARDYDPSTVMEALSTDQCIDIVWAVLEGGDALDLALEFADV